MTFRSHGGVVLLAVLMLTLAKPSRAQDKSKSKSFSAEQVQVLNTVGTIFAAAEADDLHKFHSVIAPSFYIRQR